MTHVRVGGSSASHQLDGWAAAGRGERAPAGR